jgi:hypothetical protein
MREGTVLFLDGFEDDALALAQREEDAVLERTGPEEDLGQVVVTDDDADAGCGVVDLDDALHQTFSIFPALMQEVQTRIRFELLPWRTRTRWMLGSQRRLERLWEKLTCFPTQGSLPQISQR